MAPQCCKLLWGNHGNTIQNITQTLENFLKQLKKTTEIMSLYSNVAVEF